MALVVALFACSVLLQAQDYDPNAKQNENKGFTASELISGASTSINGMVTFDSSVGFNFTKNFGFDVGVPYLFDTRPGVFTGAGNRPYDVSNDQASCNGFFGCYTGITGNTRFTAGELGNVYADYIIPSPTTGITL